MNVTNILKKFSLNWINKVKTLDDPLFIYVSATVLRVFSLVLSKGNAYCVFGQKVISISTSQLSYPSGQKNLEKAIEIFKIKYPSQKIERIVKHPYCAFAYGHISSLINKSLIVCATYLTAHLCFTTSIKKIFSIIKTGSFDTTLAFSSSRIHRYIWHILILGPLLFKMIYTIQDTLNIYEKESPGYAQCYRKKALTVSDVFEYIWTMRLAVCLIAQTATSRTTLLAGLIFTAFACLTLHFRCKPRTISCLNEICSILDSLLSVRECDFSQNTTERLQRRIQSL